MTKMIELTDSISSNLTGFRLDQALKKLFPDFSRSVLTQWIRSGEVTVNGEILKPKDKVVTGQIITIKATSPFEESWEAENIPLDIVYEDAYLMVINKPASMVVHPGAGTYHGTLVNALLHHEPRLSELPRAGLIHRLDKNTTGLLVVAKELASHADMVKQLQERSIERAYDAIIHGVVTGGGCVDAPIGRHPGHRTKMSVQVKGRPAKTHYRLMKKYNHWTHLEVKLETGRTHQIRVHLSHIHYPIVGDPLYGRANPTTKGLSLELIALVKTFPRQALHAKRLTFFHPSSKKKLTFEAPVPYDMENLLKQMELAGHAKEPISIK